MRKNLQEARKGKGWTQQEVADKLGVTLKYYQKVEYSGYINEYSEIVQIFVPPKEEIKRHIERIRDFRKQLQVRHTNALLIILVSSHGPSDFVRERLNGISPVNPGGSHPVIKNHEDSSQI